MMQPNSRKDAPSMLSPVDASQSERPTTANDALVLLTRRRLYAGVALVVAAVGIGVIVYRLGAAPAARPQPAAGAEIGASFVKDGNLIRIPEGSPLRRQLSVQAVMQREVVRDLVIPAVVEADPARIMKVLPPLAGRVTELNVRLGERVERGQPLLVMDSPDLRSAYADYDRSKVTLDLTAKNRDRLRSLGVGGGVALKDIQNADAEFITANAEHQRAEARLQQIGVDPNAVNKSRIVTIAAPISGSILDLSVAPGAYWNDTTASMLTIADLSKIFVTANLPEKDTTRVTEGQAVAVRLAAYPGEVLEGVVSFISASLDADTRRTKVRITFDNPRTRLKPGMFASVTFFSGKEIVPVIPVSALLFRDDASQVFVEVAPWVFEPRPLDVGFQKDDQAIVQGGVQAGDRVIVKGGVLLND
ncbi:efflux RND transporter periplasmic adaptor subunit [Rhodopseudomonas pseudopalustris]|uniref:efflux RND transporter periplasmic adaptor subunit n=1 Tax=Rhodopseudomonas pseudopalustris TaxID=1513892 RepID=UPI003F9E5E29